jgi:hemerythrin-like domain-containing protein
MAEMSMNKVIHAAVRRDLDRFVAALDTFPTGDRGRAAGLLKAWDNFDAELTRHHEGEHRIAWPVLRSVGVSQALLTGMDGEHDTMAAALADARTAMGALARSAGAEEASSARDAVARLREVTAAHLDHEEAELEGVYQANRDTPEMKAMGKAFARDGGASRGGRFFAWVLDGAGPEERRAVTSEVPGPVLAVLTKVFGRG